MNRLTSVTDLTGAATSYTYDANGNRSTMTYANGVTTNYAYDICNRLTAETVTDSAGTVLESYAITLGAAGERTQIVELHRTVAYEYDSLYRLTKEIISADGLSKETSYTYDAMGNRLTKTSDGVVTSYTYNVLNQLLSENDIAYTYDANGSQVSQQSPAKTAAYTYDQEGRLTSAVVTAGGTTTTEEYRYNWTGIRNAKITDGVETRYLIDPNSSLSQVVAELDSVGNLVTFYTRGAELISLHRTGETRYYQYDPNGSVRLLTDGSGAVTDTYTYDAFGNLLGKTGATVNNYLYNGEQFDANTGFYYLRARYMNPSTGTFISMDPAQGSIFDPVSLHKYLYANANPVMNCDPSGRETLGELGTAMAMQSAIGAAVGGLFSGLVYLAEGGRNPQELIHSMLTGAIGGAIFGAVFGAFGSVFTQTGFQLGKILLAGICALLGAESSVYFGSKAYQEYRKGNILGAIIYSILAVASTVLTAIGVKSIVKDIKGYSGAAGSATEGAGNAVDPKTIRFSQGSIGKTFGMATKNAGESVNDLIKGLKNGSIDPNDIPAIRIFEKNGKIYTLDNRRLYAFQEAGININTVWATAEEVTNEAWKFKPINDGLTIKVRGD